MTVIFAQQCDASADICGVAKPSEPRVHPHDALIRRTFGVPEHAVGELKAVLPAVVCQSAHWDTLSLVTTSVVDPELQQRHMDLLYTVELVDRQAYIYVLLEAQATVDSRMPLRLLIYMARIWENWLRQASPSAAPPPIIPVVLHHGDRRWHHSVEFSDQFELDSSLATALAPLLPRFRFVLDDLRTRSDEQLLARDLSALAQLTLGALKYGKNAHLTDRFVPSWARFIQALLSQPNGFVELDTIIYYLLTVNPKTDINTLEDAMQEYAGTDAARAVNTVGNRLRAEGHKEGRKQGHKEGLVLALLTIFEVRGLVVSEVAKQRIENASDMPILQQWLRRAATVTSADEIFTPLTDD